MPLDPEHPLRIPTKKWSEKIKLARKFKRENFDVYAKEAMAFYTGFNSAEAWETYMAGKDGQGVVAEDSQPPSVQFKFMLARVAELVQIYGPMLYHRNPVRTVTPRQLAEIPVELYDMQVPSAQQLMQQQMQQMQGMGMQQVPPEQMQQLQQQVAQQRQQMVEQAHQQALMEQNQYLEVAKARARLMETYLNYTPNELNLKKHARQAIEETLIKGMGVCWTELHQPYPDGPTLVGSFYDSVDNLVIDPDAEEIENARWVGRRYKEPIWQVADEYEVSEQMLHDKSKDAVTTLDKYSEQKVEREWDEPDDEESRSNDEITYWKIYSKMGMGDRLAGIPKEHRRLLDEFGDNIYLVIAEGIDYPLNLPEGLLIALLKAREEGEEELAEQLYDEIFERIQWPIPFWIENEWPFEELSFHFIPNEPYPMSHVRPGLPELKFSNWTMSFLADHARHTSRLLIGLLASLEDEDANKITDGGPIESIKFSQSEGKSLSDVMAYMTPPKGTAMDLWNINEKNEENFDKRTGLSETMYAAPGGSRSATEAEMKREALNIRPDDMANRVEDWMSRLARKEALAIQWLLEAEDVAPVLGPVGVRLWEQLVLPADPAQLVLEFDYRIEAGSARKPNKAQKIENMQQALQTLLPVAAQQMELSGDVDPVNALLADWGKANDIDNVERYLFKPPDPEEKERQRQMEDAQFQMEQQKAQMEQQKLQLEAMKLQAEMQGKGMDAEVKQLETLQKHMEMQFKQQEAEMDLATKEQEMAQDQQEHEQELVQDQQKHEQEMAQEEEMSQLKLELERMMGRQKVQQIKAQAQAKPKTKQGA